jgi:hypothetical protein
MNISKYPINVQVQALKELIRDEYRRSLYKTAKHLLGYSAMTWHTHGEMIEALEDSNDRKLIVMPRGTFKSSVGSVAYPIWRLLSNPNLRILIDSEVYSNSKNFLREIRAHLLGNTQLRDLFGEFKSSNWNESEITIAQRTAIKKEASITCGGIGTIKVGQHYDLIIADDLNSQNNSETTEGRKKVIRHYQMYTGLLDPGGQIVVIGTRYAVDDVIGHIIENEIGEAA